MLALGFAIIVLKTCSSSSFETQQEKQSLLKNTSVTPCQKFMLNEMLRKKYRPGHLTDGNLCLSSEVQVNTKPHCSCAALKHTCDVPKPLCKWHMTHPSSPFTLYLTLKPWLKGSILILHNPMGRNLLNSLNNDSCMTKNL